MSDSQLKVNPPEKPWSVYTSLAIVVLVMVTILALRQQHEPMQALPPNQMESWMLEGLPGIGPQRAPQLLAAIHQALDEGVILIQIIHRRSELLI